MCIDTKKNVAPTPTLFFRAAGTIRSAVDKHTMSEDEGDSAGLSSSFGARNDPLAALKHAALLNGAASGQNDHEQPPNEHPEQVRFDDSKNDDDSTVVPDIGRATMVKRVSWVNGVAESKSAHIAISIPRHKYLKVI